jgi:oligosaccharide repeat unit polymerase
MVNNIINISIFVFLILIYLGDLIPINYDHGFLSFLLLLDFVALISFSLKKEKFKSLADTKLKFSTLFLLGFLIVHFQGYLDLFLGFLDENFQLFWVNKNNILKSLLYCSLALNGFLVGHSLYKSKQPRSIDSRELHNSVKPLKLINLILFVFFLSQIDSTFLDSSLYGRREMSPMLGYSTLFFETSFIALTVHIIRNTVISQQKVFLKKYIQQFGYSFYLFLAYLICILFSGDRGPIIYLSLTFAFGYILTARIKISTLQFYIYFFAVSIFVSLIGIIRRFSMHNSAIESIMTADYYNRYYPNSIIPFTKELAGSIRTVHIAIDSVPEKYNYFYGFFNFQNFSLIIPGFNGFINSALGTDLEYMTSARFLTFLDLGRNATWGIGTSSVADLYLDFGVVGLTILFLIFGYFSRKIEVNVFVYSSFKVIPLILYVLYFGFSIYISRSNLFVPLVKLPYVLCFYYLGIATNRKLR